MSFEAELENALTYRAALILEAVTHTLFDLDPARGMHPSDRLARTHVATLNLKGAEALTAVILNRCGASWDVLASRFEVSKQSLHTRLAKPGEKLFKLAQDYPDIHANDVRHEVPYIAAFAPTSADQLLAELRATSGRLAALRRESAWWLAQDEF